MAVNEQLLLQHGQVDLFVAGRVHRLELDLDHAIEVGLLVLVDALAHRFRHVRGVGVVTVAGLVVVVWQRMGG